MNHRSTGLREIDGDIWGMSFPLRMLGVDLQRNVTVIRLASGKLIVHSTAPFEAEDVAAIRELGEPVWLVDALLRHDTFSAEGSRAFPEARYLAPAGFRHAEELPVEPLIPPPAEWAEEIAVEAIGGAPEFGEVVMLHRPSRTLIVADLIFNFTGEPGFFMRWILRLSMAGRSWNPGVTKPFKKAIKDREAFAASVGRVLEWDFDRVIVGHGEPLEADGKEKLRRALKEAGVPAQN